MYLSLSILQLTIVLLASFCFLAAFILGFRMLRPQPAGMVSPLPGRLPQDRSILATALGVLLAVCLLAWRAGNAGKISLPLSDFFDAFLLLGLLLAAMGLYFRWTRYLRSLAVFLQPMIALLLWLGALMNLLARHPFEVADSWTAIHVVAILLAYGCVTAAAVGGGVYLIADHQLRLRGLDPAHRLLGLPPLASIEKFSHTLTLLGFPFLTIAVLTGFLEIFLKGQSLGGPWYTSPKVILALLAWALYAFLLQIRLTPSLRGRPAAWLSITGFLLLTAVWTAVNFVPKG